MPVAPDLSGRALDGRYELHALIGEGAFGRVYRGHDRRLARPVAVKVIKPWWAEDPDWVLSFEREAQLLARVNDPGIVQIFDVGHSEEGLYYVAELVDGESLASRLQRGALSPLDACQLAEQLCRALAQAHAKRVVHRDIKPANVLISADGRVKVGDFGVARLAEGSTDGDSATIVGTPRYMAPEQARGLPATSATDIYSVGIVLYEMLAGAPPFTQGSAVEMALHHLQDPPPPLPSTVPPALVAVVGRALAKAPAARYQSAGEMADALAQARASIPARAREAAVTSTAGVSRAYSAVEPTRLAARWTRRRNVNTNDRRHARSIFTLVFGLLIALAGSAALIALGSQVKVPQFRGLSRSAVLASAKGLDLHLAFASRYDPAPAGLAIAQGPRPGIRVDAGTTVRVVLSAGPPPVEVPSLLGRSSASAASGLTGLGLRGAFSPVPAPGKATGTVVAQMPSAGTELGRGSTVALQVAQSPRWRPLTSFSGQASARSVAFRIRGRRWRIVYGLHYQGTCTLIFICSGPTAEISRGSGSQVRRFDLGEGTGQVLGLQAGPGIYEIAVTPGSDTARWSLNVQDFY